MRFGIGMGLRGDEGGKEGGGSLAVVATRKVSASFTSMYL